VVALLKLLRGIRRVGLRRLAGLGIFRHNPHQLSGVGKRKRAQQHRIDHAEHRDICPNPQPQDQDRNGRKRPVAAQRSKRKLQILHQDFQPRQTARLALPLPGLLHAAEPHHRFAPRFIGSHPRAHIFFHRKLQMALHLRIQFHVLLALAKQRLHPSHSLLERRHHRPPSTGIVNTRLMTFDKRCQYAESFTNCFRPLAVMA